MRLTAIVMGKVSVVRRSSDRPPAMPNVAQNTLDNLWRIIEEVTGNKEDQGRREVDLGSPVTRNISSREDIIFG